MQQWHLSKNLFHLDVKCFLVDLHHFIWMKWKSCLTSRHRFFLSDFCIYHVDCIQQIPPNSILLLHVKLMSIGNILTYTFILIYVKNRGFKSSHSHTKWTSIKMSWNSSRCCVSYMLHFYLLIVQFLFL